MNILFVCPSLQILNTLTGFEETWLELHTIEQELKTVINSTL